MAHTLTIELDDRTFSEMVATARVRGETPEYVVSTAVKDLYEDPLFILAGSIDTGVPDLALRHDRYLAAASTSISMTDREGHPQTSVFNK